MSSDDMTPAISLRERKKLETRRMIRRVALDLALEHGLEDLTVEAIAHGAGVSPRTFFNYFPRKEDALVTDAAAAAATLHPRIVARPAAESPLHAIRAVITELDFFALMNTDRDRTLARQKLVQQHPSLLARQLAQHALMEASLADAIAERLGTSTADDLRPALVASVAGAAMRVAIHQWTERADTGLSDILTTAFDMLGHGLLTHMPSDEAGTDADATAADADAETDAGR